MKTVQRHPKRLIRAVYPDGSDKRGYHIILTMQNAKSLAIPHWLTKWVGNVTPQTFGSY
jgi:hypothetical protein